MAYDGEVLSMSGAIPIDCSHAKVIAVSGSGPNVCGHLLLHTRAGGLYFHVAEFRGYPRYMTSSGYRRYLRDAGKSEIRRVLVPLPNPESADRYLERLMSETWTWGVVPNNCVAFVEEVISAGGGTWSSISNCPSVAVQDTVPDQIERRATSYLNQLESWIYSQAGMAR